MKTIEKDKAHYTDQVRRFKACVDEYELIQNEALIVVKSEEISVLRTAALQMEMLVKEYKNVVNMGQDLLTLVKDVPEASHSDKESFHCSKIKTQIFPSYRLIKSIETLRMV